MFEKMKEIWEKFYRGEKPTVYEDVVTPETADATIEGDLDATPIKPIAIPIACENASMFAKPKTYGRAKKRSSKKSRRRKMQKESRRKNRRPR